MSNFVCASCHTIGAAKRCGGCNKVWYCNQICQHKDWKKHKKNCDYKCKIKKNIKNRTHKSKPHRIINSSNSSIIDPSIKIKIDTLDNDNKTDKIYNYEKKKVSGYIRREQANNLSLSQIMPFISMLCFVYYYVDEFFLYQGTETECSLDLSTVTKIKNGDSNTAFDGDSNTVFGRQWIRQKTKKICKWTFRINKIAPCDMDKFFLGGAVEIGFATNTYSSESMSEWKWRERYAYWYSTDGRYGWCLDGTRYISRNAEKCKEGDIITMYLDLCNLKIKYQINYGQIRILHNIKMKIASWRMAVSCNEISDSVTLLSYSSTDSI